MASVGVQGEEAAAGETVVKVAADGSGSDLTLDNFELSAPVKSLLRSQGIESLFPIQAQCLKAGLPDPRKGAQLCSQH